MRLEQTEILCGDVRLYAELRFPKKIPAPAVLICHGMNSQGFQGLRVYTQLAEQACELGFVSLLFDFRGTGNSGGTFDYGYAEQDDFKCALEFLTSRPEVMSKNISVIGHSLGGAVSLCMLRCEPRVKALVLWAVPKNHDYNVRKFVKRTRGRLGLCLFLLLSPLDRLFDVSRFFRLRVYGIDLRLKEVRNRLMRLNETEAASRLNGLPVLVIVGGTDRIVGRDEAEVIYSALHGPKSLSVIESADHVFRGKEKELIDVTLDWIRKWT
jgi:alpha/beta superfamily hydrolase